MKKRIFLNSLSSFSLGIIMLVSIPTMINILDTNTWVRVSMYQAVGLISSFLISFGWSTYGPQRIQYFSKRNLYHEYIKSIKIQLASASIAGVLIASYLIIMSSNEKLLYLTSFLSVAILGARSSWVYIGLDLQFENLKYETLPRFFFNILGLLFMLLREDVTYFFTCQILGILISIFITTMWLKKEFTVNLPSKLHSQKINQDSLSGAFAPVVNAITTFTPLFILQHYNLEKAALLAFLLRVRMQYLTLASPLTDSLVSYKLIRHSDSKSNNNVLYFMYYLELAVMAALAFPVFVSGIVFFIDQPDITFSNTELLLFSIYIGTFYAWNIAYSTESANINKAKLLLLSIGSFFGIVFATFFGLQFSSLVQTFSLMFIVQIIAFLALLKLTKRS